MNNESKSRTDKRPKGRLLKRQLPDVLDCSYLMRLSPAPDPTRVLVVVHGIARRASSMLASFENAADKYNYTLIAPIFNDRTYGDYQRLGRVGRGARADVALQAILADAKQWLGLNKPVHLFGFSGGAQFAHRFIYAHPTQMASVTLAAAGWYTSPESKKHFPYGIGRSEKLLDLRFDSERLVRTPSMVMIGANDVNRDGSVRETPWLNRTQGNTRLARAEWFHSRLVSLARHHNYSTSHRFYILPDTAHDFGAAVIHGGLDKILLQFCEECPTQSPCQQVA